MPSRFATTKRNAPTDFGESERQVKMMRSDNTPTPVRDFATIAGIPAPAKAPSPSEGALKRKREALNASEKFATSKKARLDTTFSVAGTTKISLTGCRGGKKRAKRPKRAIVDGGKENATGESTSPTSVGKDTAEVSASTEGDTPVATSEGTVKAEEDSAEGNNEATISSPSAAKDTAEVPADKKEDAAATTSELAEYYLDVLVGKNTAESPTSTEEDAAVTATEGAVEAKDDIDAPADQGTAEVPTSSEGNAAVKATEGAAKVEDDSDNSSEPVSNSRRSVSGSIKSTDSSSSEPASSSQKSANESSETLGTIETVSEPEEAPKKTTRMAVKKERYITGLLNNGNQCFANSTLQFFDAAMDGHDLDLVLGKDESIAPFSNPRLSKHDSEDPEDTNAPRKGKKPVTRIGKVKASIRDRITKLRSGGKLKEISPRKHLRALLSRMRGSRDTGQPDWLTPMLFQQILAFGGTEESTVLTDLDGTTQQDCFEYFSALMSGATSTTIEESDAAPEDGAESAATLKSLFAIKSETGKVCDNLDCDYKGPVQVEINDAVSTSVWKSKERLDLMDMLDESNESMLEGQKCPKCGEEKLAHVTELKEASDNLVVHINRVDGSGNGKKFQDLVELPLKPITICGKKFVLNAVVKHKGSTVNGGHYTVLRRRSPEWMTNDKSLWYLIDDEDIWSINMSNFKDGGRYGHSAMLLFKAL